MSSPLTIVQQVCPPSSVIPKVDYNGSDQVSYAPWIILKDKACINTGVIVLICLEMGILLCLSEYLACTLGDKLLTYHTENIICHLARTFVVGVDTI